MYDHAKQEAYFMKDSWRVDHPEVKREHKVYERLAEAGVENVLTCYGGEDVGEGTGLGWQKTRTADYITPLFEAAVANEVTPSADDPDNEEDGDDDKGDDDEDIDGVGDASAGYDTHSDHPDETEGDRPDDKTQGGDSSDDGGDSFDPPQRCPRGHYRIFLKEICRPLIEFADWQELLIFLIHALCGKPLPASLYRDRSNLLQSAHRDAWVKAGILHRDVSVNNILIVEKQSVDSSGLVTVIRVAVLCDWDLCKYKEQMGIVQRTPDRTVRIFFTDTTKELIAYAHL